jgi:uncharacterized damage-inducible protein DinB
MRTTHCVLCKTPRPVDPDPVRTQRATAGKIARLAARLTRAALLRCPAPGKWSIHEIVCHLADVEVVNSWRYRKVLANEALGPTAWNQDQWAATHQYRRQDFRLALEQFRSLRERNLSLLAVVGKRAWSRAVRHQVGGRLTAGQILAHVAHHDVNHLEQIARIRKELKSREPKRD